MQYDAVGELRPPSHMEVPRPNQPTHLGVASHGFLPPHPAKLQPDQPSSSLKVHRVRNHGNHGILHLLHSSMLVVIHHFPLACCKASVPKHRFFSSTSKFRIPLPDLFQFLLGSARTGPVHTISPAERRTVNKCFWFSL